MRYVNSDTNSTARLEYFLYYVSIRVIYKINRT
jgi:hypothetical protein